MLYALNGTEKTVIGNFANIEAAYDFLLENCDDDFYPDAEIYFIENGVKYLFEADCFMEIEEE